MGTNVPVFTQLNRSATKTFCNIENIWFVHITLSKLYIKKKKTLITLQFANANQGTVGKES